jgi:predicted acyltransferase
VDSYTSDVVDPKREPSPHSASGAEHHGLTSAPKGLPHRLVSLDAFRGATIALMVLVNDPGSDASYAQLKHSEWNGWTLTDTVFPSFLWIVGVAIALSLFRRLESGVPRRQLLLQVARRASVLYAFGLLVYIFPYFDLAHLRILGVLQRIAICYFCVSVISLTASLRGQIYWILGLLAAYWALMTLIPVPGFGAGNLGVEGNFAHFVDRLVLGKHNYLQTATWDPEGIVSTLPAIATTLLGLMAGHILRAGESLSRRVAWMFFWGNLLMLAGLVCSVWLPINKKLWTDSFALFMGGLDFVAFAVFAWTLDELKLRRGIQPFVVFGMNAIAVYMCSELLAVTLDTVRVDGKTLHFWIFQHLFSGLGSPENASLLFALAFVGLMYLVAYGLYRRRLFLRV